ncbi:hypothetical protein H2198_005108 [Neophaeococcomyces mojaviensis]|uniref:Uncharacterized protein n=1 Tax=Neophaeococcomyces mojaviensis TaxID=3383035 RepID=A0ACC3A762_9EURO|nr:hypothetical protein H2198_005108 [Knufia sp. JES_112]
MAKAVAVLGLVASIVSLVEFSTKIVSRLHQFMSNSSDIRESFHSLSNQLPLLTAALDHIHSQAEAGRLPSPIPIALKTIIDSTLTQVTFIDTCLSNILPQNDATKFERTLKALKSGKRRKSDRVLAELSKLHPSPPNPFKSLGLYLGQAVQIQPDAFKGRNNELQLLRDWLLPANHIRCQSLRRCGGNGGHGEDTILPGTSLRTHSPTGYDIQPFFPIRSQGSILITTRSTKFTFSKQLYHQKLEDLSMAVAILSQRSRRDLPKDRGALDLARWLGGLPLALATAETYLASPDVSCSEYLDLYESLWMMLVGGDSEGLMEYEDRTLASTWTISVNQVRAQNEDAAELLKFLAFLSPQDIWYELIKAGAADEVPWTRRIT